MFVEHAPCDVKVWNWEGSIFNGIQSCSAIAPLIWPTLLPWWNLNVRGPQPKTRYCGHVNSRLTHSMSQWNQTVEVSYHKWGRSIEWEGTMDTNGILWCGPLMMIMQCIDTLLFYGLAFTMADLPGFIVPLIGLVGCSLLLVSSPQVHGAAGLPAFGPAAKREEGGLSHRGIGCPGR